MTTSDALEAAPALVPGRAPLVIVCEWSLLARAGAQPPEILKRPAASLVVLAEPTQAADAARAMRGRAFAVLERNAVPPPGIELLLESAHAAANPPVRPAPAPLALVAASRLMRSVVSRVLGWAEGGVPVLLAGEEGTGKKALARALHERGPRRARPFVVLSMAALTSEADDEQTRILEDGAERAGLGSLLLERIDLLGPAAQATLARWLGSTSSAARVVSTAATTVHEAQRSGGFDRELYYRLSIRAVDVPPLRDRPDDIPVLAYTFARRAADEAGLPAKRISVEALRALRGAPWPGNVAELSTRMQQAVLATPDREVLTLGDLGFERPLPPRALALATTPYLTARREALDGFEQAYVEAVLTHAGGNISRAAELAQMDRANFRRILKRSRAKKGP